MPRKIDIYVRPQCVNLATEFQNGQFCLRDTRTKALYASTAEQRHEREERIGRLVGECIWDLPNGKGIQVTFQSREHGVMCLTLPEDCAQEVIDRISSLKAKNGEKIWNVIPRENKIPLRSSH